MKRTGKMFCRRAAVFLLSLIFACSVFIIPVFATEITPEPDPVDPGLSSTVTESSEFSSSEEPPASSEEAPVSSEAPPASSEEPPVSSEAPPASSEAPPASSEVPTSEVSSKVSSKVSSDVSSEVSSTISSAASSEVSSAVSSDSSEVSGRSSSESAVSSAISSDTSGDNSDVSDTPSSESGDVSEQIPSRVITDPNAGVNPYISAPENNDPSQLSSQDWSELLSGLESGAVNSDGSSSSVSKAKDESSEGSDASDPLQNGAKRSSATWLMFVGIFLLILGVVGVGGFIYLQFILPRKRHYNTMEDLNSAEGSAAAASQFEDISSYSSPEFATSQDQVDISSISGDTLDIPLGAPDSLDADADDSAVQQEEKTAHEDTHSYSASSQAAASKAVPKVSSAQMQRASSQSSKDPQASQQPVDPAQNSQPKDTINDDFDWDQFFKK